MAAHALLCAIRGSPQAFNLAAKGVDRRCRQAAAFLSDMPAALETAGFSQASVSSPKDTDESGLLEQQRGLIMDALLHAHGTSHEPLLDQLLELKNELTQKKSGQYFVAVARQGSYDDLCKRVCSSLASEDKSETAALDRAIGSARAWVRLGEFTFLLVGSLAKFNISIFLTASCMPRRNECSVEWERFNGSIRFPWDEAWRICDPEKLLESFHTRPNFNLF